MLAAVRNSVNQNPFSELAVNLQKPQYSLRWLVLEITLWSVALGCFAYLFRTPGLSNPEHILFPFFLFFIAAGAALGNLVKFPVVGGCIGLVPGIYMWNQLMHTLS